MNALYRRPGDAEFERAQHLSAQRQHGAARPLLIAAAALEHPQALCWLAIATHHGLGAPADPPSAIPLYQRAVRAGDAEAAVRLAVMRLHGRWLPLDVDALLDELRPALLQAHPQVREWLHVLGAGATASSDDARQQLATALSAPAPTLQPLSAGRLVAIADDVVPAPERQRLMAQARPRLQRAMVINPHTRSLVEDPARNNRSAPLGTGAPDLVLAFSEWRIARAAGMPLAHAEYLAALCYAPGEEYRPHRDYLLPATHPEQFAAGAPGQRVRTAFAYLNDVPAGGATEFPLLDLRIAPKAGRVVVFDNVRADGTPDPQTLHAGRPVEAGEKWLATLWLRHRPLRLA